MSNATETTETTAAATDPCTLEAAKKFLQEKGTESVNAKGTVLAVPASAMTSFYDACGIPTSMLERMRKTTTVLNNAAISVAGDRVLGIIEEKKNEPGFDPTAIRYTVRMKDPGGNAEIVMGGLRHHNNPQGGDKTAEYGWVRGTVGIDRCFDDNMINDIQSQIKSALGK